MKLWRCAACGTPFSDVPLPDPPTDTDPLGLEKGGIWFFILACPACSMLNRITKQKNIALHPSKSTQKDLER